MSGHSASGVGAMHESQSMAEVVVNTDGTTTVGHYKLGKYICPAAIFIKSCWYYIIFHISILIIVLICFF